MNSGHAIIDSPLGELTQRSHFDLPVRLHGDHRQCRIWNRLTAIPYRDTVTYRDLAAELADGTTARQVGAAVSRNPISIVMPCHRFVRRDGKLTGYAELRAARLF